jgi:hypothetical protein
MNKLARLCVLVTAGLSAGTLLAAGAHAQTQGAAPASQAEDIATLKEEVERLKGLVPAQAVAMTVVEYNFSNLWFAAHERNWPLARFFLSETRARLRWALRLSPQRRISSGFLELQPFLDAFEQPHYAALEDSLEDGDIAAFERAYEGALTACASCHAASEKPFLRVKIPSAPAGALIDFDAD